MFKISAGEQRLQKKRGHFMPLLGRLKPYFQFLKRKLFKTAKHEEVRNFSSWFNDQTTLAYSHSDLVSILNPKKLARLKDKVN